jgi:hypothetical protein
MSSGRQGMSGESWFLTCLVQAVSGSAGMSESASMVARRDHGDMKQQIPVIRPGPAIISGESRHCALRLSFFELCKTVSNHGSAVEFELKHHYSSMSS